MNYFGKPRECYKCHIKSVHESWSRLYEQKESMIKNLCDQYDIPIERFKASSLLSVAFHDAGKLSLRFQQEMYDIALKNKWANPHVICQKCSSSIITPSQDRKTEPYRHEIISGFASLYLSSILDDEYGKLSRIDFPFEFFAVLGHHKPVNPDIFRREWNRFYGESDELEMVGYGEEQWNYVIEVARTLFEVEGMKFPFIEWKDIYGAIYNWWVVEDLNGICPEGWHIPERDEWSVLSNCIGTFNGNMLKSCRQVDSPLGGDCNTSEHPRWDEHEVNFGTDEYGFSGFPGGSRNNNGGFIYIGISGVWWSSTEDGTFSACTARLDNYFEILDVEDYDKKNAFSIRCIKD